MARNGGMATKTTTHASNNRRFKLMYVVMYKRVTPLIGRIKTNKQ